jgi:anti-sigma-K factor RskA
VRQPSGDLIDRLAAEYALGTLRGPARGRFERWLGDRPEVAAAVREWEDRLLALGGPVAPVAPSADVWRRIEARLGIAVLAPRASRVPRWRAYAVAASVAVALIAGWLLLENREPARHWQVAAQLIPANTTEVAWRVEVDRDAAALRVTAERPLAAPAGRSHELWALSDKGAAVSLGVLPQAGAALVKLNAAQLAAIGGARNFAVSREPLGGSPTGQPTGPVLLVVPATVLPAHA